MKKILVVGSGPSASLEMCDHIYFANYSSLAFSEAAIASASPKTTNLIGALALNPGLNKFSPNWSLSEPSLELRNRGSQRQVIFCNSDRTLTEARRLFVSEEEILGPRQFQEIYLDLVGQGVPFLNVKHFFAGTLRDPIEFRTLLRQLRRLNTNPETLFSRGVKNYFRPSAGLMALSLAIYENGLDATYVTTGISFGSRSFHSIGLPTTQDRRWFHRHRLADQVLFAKLLAKYDIELS